MMNDSENRIPLWLDCDPGISYDIKITYGKTPLEKENMLNSLLYIHHLKLKSLTLR